MLVCFFGSGGLLMEEGPQSPSTDPTQTPLSLAWSNVRGKYALDTRSLALMRILVGSSFVGCRLLNWPHIREFYTDFGSYPRVCANLFAGQPHFPHGASLFNAIGSDLGVHFLYCLTIAFGLAVALGYRTRLATLGCFVLGMSLYYRCPLINPASDAEILLCLFFGFFSRWGEQWSLDRRRGTQLWPQIPRLLDCPTLAWRLQLAALYITAAYSKVSLHWGNGTASYVAMRSDLWSSWIGREIAAVLAVHPQFSAQLTAFVVFLEFILPFLLLIPSLRVQFVGWCGLVLMHVAFGLALHLEAFSPLAISCLSGLLPAFAWPYLSGLQRMLDWCFTAPAQKNSEPLPSNSSSWLDPLAGAVVTWAITGVVWSCAISTRCLNAPLTDRFWAPWHALGLQQSWGMFVPPPYQGGWTLFRGQTLSGQWVNLEVAGASADSLAMPTWLDETMPSSRHVLLYQSLILKDPKLGPLQERIAEDFRVRWEKAHPQQQNRLSVVEIFRFYREYDCYKDQVTPTELQFVYRKYIK